MASSDKLAARYGDAVQGLEDVGLDFQALGLEFRPFPRGSTRKEEQSIAQLEWALAALRRAQQELTRLQRELMTEASARLAAETRKHDPR